MDLHKIFQYLLEDDEFLTITEITNNQSERKGNTLIDIITDSKRLDPGAVENYDDFPKQIKKYLTSKYKRHGIMPVIERDNRIINVSFLMSLNLLLRPDLQENDIDSLESYISHSILANCQIDKIKNTCKVKAKNKDLEAIFSSGNLTDEVIMRIVNILEINLVIFNVDTGTNRVYWSHSTKYNFINLFRRLYVMCHVQGDYEPIVNEDPFDCKYAYTQILADYGSFEFIPDLQLAYHSIAYLNTWKISSPNWLTIVNQFHTPSFINLEEHLDRLL